MLKLQYFEIVILKVLCYTKSIFNKGRVLFVPQILTKKFHGYIFVKKFENHKTAETHSHEYIEMAYVLEGEGTTVINGKSGSIKEGNFYIIDYNSSHSYFSETKDFKIINCLFSPQIIDSSLAENMSFNDAMSSYFFRITGRYINYPAADCLYYDETGEIRALFEKMLNEFVEAEPGHLELIRYYLRTAIIKLARKIGSTNKLSDDIKMIIDIINKRCNENISLGDIATEIHYSLPYLSAKFKRETGMTFTRYLQNTRIEKAASLLTATDMPIEQIAEQSGYKDLNTFYLVFKRLTNVTPKEYRKKSNRKFVK